MAFVHSKGTAVAIDGDDMTAFANTVTFTRTADTHDTTTFGKNSKTYATGLKDGTGSFEGFYDNTAVTGPGAVIRPLIGGPATTFVFRPEGAGSGKPNATVQVIVNSYEESSAVADMVTFSAELQFTGDIVDSTGP